jgi:hypothetical protein
LPYETQSRDNQMESESQRSRKHERSQGKEVVVDCRGKGAIWNNIEGGAALRKDANMVNVDMRAKARFD